MVHQTNVLMYFFQAGLVVKTVMLLLLLTSIASWTLIFQRQRYLKQNQRDCQLFLQRFKSTNDLTSLYSDLERRKNAHQGLSSVFLSGFKAFLSSRKSGIKGTETIQRAMMIRHAEEEEGLTAHLTLFASIGAIAPFVGLLGTVWGIMTSFQALGQSQQATIAMVAPGISEALVATALGLFTAIPAFLAYNFFSDKASKILNQYDRFEEEFVLIIEQQQARETNSAAKQEEDALC